MQIQQAAKLIYEDYKLHAAKCLLLRSGHLLVGACDTPEHRYSTEPLSTACDPHRPDSVAEHSDGVITLAHSTSMWCPRLLPANQLRRIVQLFLYHDAAETVSGDIPDDGDRNDQDKDASELNILSRLTIHWPRNRQGELLSDFIKFQNHDEVMFQVAYCLDKIEAPLRLLEYERAGIVGSLENKPHMSQQDRRFATEIGTAIAADGWSRHAFERIENCAGRDLAYWILHTAFTDVRGSAPVWMLRFAPH